jgi:hypothetical protein
LIEPSNFFREQAAMQNRSGQTAPQTPPSGLLCMISAAERLISEGFPTRAAMMKSNGEQFTGQASLQGFSSQYSHLSNSVWSWCLVMICESVLPFFSMEHLT